MWTLEEIIEWCQGNRYKRLEAEAVNTLQEYNNAHNKRMQEWEDKQWDRDIEYRAQTMLNEYNYKMDQWRIRYQDIWDKSEHVRMYKPLIIAPLSRSAVYKLYSPEDAKYGYGEGKLNIGEEVSKRFNQLLEEQCKQTKE